MSASERTVRRRARARLQTGLERPRSGDRAGTASTLRRTRPSMPDPAEVDVPAELRARDRGTTCRATPTATRRRCPRCTPRRAARLVLARGDPPGGRGDAGHARVPVVGRDLLRHAQRPSRSGAATCTCAPASPATLRNAAGGLRGVSRRGRGRAGSRTSRSASSSASAPATWRRWRRSTAATSGRSTPSDARRDRRCAIRDGREEVAARPRPRATTSYRLPVGRQGADDEHDRAPLPSDIDEPGPRTDRRSTSASAATGAAQGADRDGPGRGPEGARGVRPARPRRRRLLDGQEGQLHPQGRRWTSTSAATPTSPSPAPSRTAC